MFTAMLMLAVAPANYDRDAQAALALALARQPAKVVKTTPVRKPLPRGAPADFLPSATYPRGYHEHQCPCGKRWGGVSGDHGHHCPICGRYVNEQAGSIRLPPPQPKPVRVVPHAFLPQSGIACLS